MTCEKHPEMSLVPGPCMRCNVERILPGRTLPDVEAACSGGGYLLPEVAQALVRDHRRALRALRFYKDKKHIRLRYSAAYIGPATKEAIDEGETATKALNEMEIKDDQG